MTVSFQCLICGMISDPKDQQHDQRFHALHEKVEGLEELCIDLTRLVTKGKAATSVPADEDPDIRELRKCRSEGLCGVLIEDHSICIRPAFDGHRHLDPPFAVGSIDAAREEGRRGSTAFPAGGEEKGMDPLRDGSEGDTQPEGVRGSHHPASAVDAGAEAMRNRCNLGQSGPLGLLACAVHGRVHTWDEVAEGAKDWKDNSAPDVPADTKGPTGMCSCDPKFGWDRHACKMGKLTRDPEAFCNCRCHTPPWRTEPGAGSATYAGPGTVTADGTFYARHPHGPPREEKDGHGWADTTHGGLMCWYCGDASLEEKPCPNKTAEAWVSQQYAITSVEGLGGPGSGGPVDARGVSEAGQGPSHPHMEQDA